MTINIAELILDVQVGLSDLPADFCTDEQIYFDLTAAEAFIDSIKSATFTDEVFEKKAIIRLGMYFTYINYTSLVERQLGSTPTASLIKLDVLRKMSLAFIRQMTNLKINDDLSVDSSREEKSYPVAAVNLNSVFTE
jgi:hypothetical protein